MFLINCPHCQISIEVLELNCCIFRCGVYRENGEQINQHMPEIEAKLLFLRDQIWGCGRQFRISKLSNGSWLISQCTGL